MLKTIFIFRIWIPNIHVAQLHIQVLKNVVGIYSFILFRLGIQIRNIKMVFNIYGTWRWVMFEKLMMKIYDFFNRLSRLVIPYNIV